jgi:hypothetical protein
VVPATYIGIRKDGRRTVNNFWKVLTLFFLGAIFVAVMTHATGFSKAAGTLFTGVNTLGTTLEAGNIKAGQ